MSKIYKIIALILAVCMLTGCAALEDTLKSAQRLSEAAIGAQWVNSSIEGVIDENTHVESQDDFYTYVNKDWILAQQLDKTEQKVDLFEPERIVYERKIKLMEDPESTGYLDNTEVGLSREELEHAGQIVAAFTKAAEDIEGRDAQGVEPIREYIEAIRNIKSLPEMTDLILDFQGMNLAGAPLVDFYVDNLVQDMGNYHVIARPVAIPQLSLKDTYAYQNIDTEAIIAKQENSAIVRNILEKLGYKTSEINDILRRAYRLEIRLAEKMCSDTQIGLSDYEEEHCEIHTLAELSELTGDYPSAQILTAYGYDSADDYAVYEPEYMERIAEIYSEKYLEELKAYYIMKTIYAACDLLDSKTHDEITYILNRGYEEEDDPLNPDTPEVREKKQFLADYLEQYINAPFEMMYISAYCHPEEKEAITAMAKDIKAQLSTILGSEEWLSETGRKNAVDKLENMQLKVLYPDRYFSYLELDIHDGMSIIEMARNASFFEKCRQAQLIGQAYDRNLWDLNLMPTTTVNAYNDITSNSMVILAGYIAGNITFDAGGKYEVNLAKLGTTIGHEMTHGFDDTGYGYDRNGRPIPYGEDVLFTSADTAAFLHKTISMMTAYHTISPMPGVETYDGDVSGEAIADMGGMKAAIMAAETKQDFDYDLFFRSYAELWRKKVTRKMEKAYVQGDVHPLAFLRTNVTLQQFDRFFETYDVKPGDGMYLAPENRIMVW